MNPLGNGNIQNQANMFSSQLSNNIQQVKGLMNMMKGNPMTIMQQNPMIGQIMQTYKGQNLENVFKSMCKEKGIDPDAIIRELQS